MKKCTCGRVTGTPYTTDQCRECWLYRYDERWQKYFHEEPKRRETPPSLVEKSAGFMGALARRAMSGFANMDEQGREARLAICKACEELQPDGTCFQCGCPVAEKAGWASEACPLGKWMAVAAAKKCGGCQGRQPPPTSPTTVADEPRTLP